jgi:hypothetical protein
VRVLPGRGYQPESVCVYRVDAGHSDSVCADRLGVVHLQGLLPHEGTVASLVHSDDNVRGRAVDHVPAGLHLQLFHLQLGLIQIHLQGDLLRPRWQSLSTLHHAQSKTSLCTRDRCVEKNHLDLQVYEA